MNEVTLEPIAYLRSEYREKFGIPRQSGLVPDLASRIEFTPEYGVPEAVRGLEEYSYLWLIWGFHGNKPKEGNRKWSPTVRPPRLGGRVRMGVFATRSPNRPNPIGLSSVKILEVTENPPSILVGGADLMDGTPIYDIKPYVPYADSHPDAAGGFTERADYRTLSVEFPEELQKKVPEATRDGLIQSLSQDPRGAYEKAPGYVYGMRFGNQDVHFRVDEDVLCVVDVTDASEPKVK